MLEIKLLDKESENSFLSLFSFCAHKTFIDKFKMYKQEKRNGKIKNIYCLSAWLSIAINLAEK